MKEKVLERARAIDIISIYSVLKSSQLDISRYDFNLAFQNFNQSFFMQLFLSSVIFSSFIISHFYFHYFFVILFQHFAYNNKLC